MRVLFVVLALTIIASTSNQQVFSKHKTSDIAEDAKLDFPGIANKYGQETEQYDVTTEDGYILKMFRIVGDNNRPILLVHGGLDSSDSFVMRGNTSLAVELARQNYDVWAINYRGNNNSRRHATLNPDTDGAFWDFSIHEIGYYDMPATVDLILKSTGQKRLSAIGYSEGATALYVLGALRPEYNNKIKVFISLAPICYMNDLEEYLASLIRMSSLINRAFMSIRVNEVFGYYSMFRRIYELICTPKSSFDLCFKNGFLVFTGKENNEIEPEFAPVIVGHFPAGTSWKNAYHQAQIGQSGRFAMFDYGPSENMARYKSTTPPAYDLSKVSMKIALFVSNSDPISTVKNVNLLRKNLPNTVEYRVMAGKAFGHLDFVWGRNTHKTMHPQIFEILNKYK